MSKITNVFSAINLLGALCAWLFIYEMYFNYRTALIITGLCLIAITIIRFCLLIKYKEEINNETPSALFRYTNRCFGLSMLIMTFSISYIFH